MARHATLTLVVGRMDCRSYRLCCQPPGRVAGCNDEHCAGLWYTLQPHSHVDQHAHVRASYFPRWFSMTSSLQYVVLVNILFIVEFQPVYSLFPLSILWHNNIIMILFLNMGIAEQHTEVMTSWRTLSWIWE